MGEDTATFAEKRGAGATTFTVLLSDILMDIVRISTPDKWLDNLLVEVCYDGDPKWYLYRNRMLPGKQVLVEDIPQPFEEIEFEPNPHEYGSADWQESDDHDTWRWPEYLELTPGDIVQVLDHENNWVTVEVMDLEEDHVALCEFKPARSKRKLENQLVVDTWYRQVRKPEEGSSSSGMIRKQDSDDEWDIDDDAEMEDEFEDASYDDKDDLIFRGETYVVDERYVIKDEDGEYLDVGYVLKPKEGESIRISQTDLLKTNWNPEYEIDVWAVSYTHLTLPTKA